MANNPRFEEWGYSCKIMSMQPSIGFIDTNLGLDHALACRGNLNVLYYIASGGAYPYLKDEISGYGFEGINKRQHLADVTGCDTVVFLDCYFGKDADDLRAAGKNVYGASEKWTRIENDRRYGWQRLQQMGVGVPSGVILKGLMSIMQYIRERQDGKKVFYIKTSKHRGSKETGSGVMNALEAMVSLTQGDFGPFLDDMEFLVQDQCPGIELGVDVFFNGKDFIRPYLFTLEEKGSGTVGKWMESSILDGLLLNRVKPSLQETGYRGNISFEFFIDEKERIYVHDPCARNGYPCSAIQAHKINNYDEVLVKVASGESVTVSVDDPYTAQIGLYTDDKASWRIIRFPEEIRESVGFRRAIIKGGNFWYVPGDFLVTTMTASASDVGAAIAEANRMAGQIECSNTAIPGHFREDVMGKIEKLNGWNIGLTF